LAATCPSMVPSDPSERLDMIEREMYGAPALVKHLLPALKELYGSFNDEQKAHLVLKFAGLRGAATASRREHAAMMRSVDMSIIERQKFYLFQLCKFVRLRLQ
jgi:hypothetical protein